MNKKVFMVFVSQPMNGVEPEVVKRNMDQTRQLLEKMHPEDDVVFNIIDNYHHFSIADRLPRTANGKRLAFLGASIQKMGYADLVVFVGNWERANGCLVEYDIVEKYGIPWFSIGSFDDEPDEEYCEELNNLIEHKETLQAPYNA